MIEPSATAARTALAGGLPTSATVASAFLAVPRHEFLSGLGAAQAYQDASVVTKSDADGLPVSAGTQPALMAVMLDQLGLARGQRVLEIGTGADRNQAAPFEAVVQGYGPGGAALAARLAGRATAWHERGRPGTARLQLTVYPPATEPVPVGGGLILRRPHASLSVGWPTMPVVR